MISHMNDVLNAIDVQLFVVSLHCFCHVLHFIIKVFVASKQT